MEEVHLQVLQLLSILPHQPHQVPQPLALGLHNQQGFLLLLIQQDLHTMVLGHLDHHLGVDLSLLDGQAHLDLHLLGDLQVVVILILPHLVSHLVDISLAFLQDLLLDMDQFQVPCQDMVSCLGKYQDQILLTG